MGKTFSPERAEMEANRIGEKFARSSDVVRDMSRAYHVDFSNIKVHTDSAADNKVKAAGKDALAQGNDVFFGKGIFESSDPADKGLVAHEFAHTMQQGAAIGGEMAVAESAPMGVAQGGIGSWFKGLFGGGKKKTEPAASAPSKAPAPKSASAPSKAAPVGPNIRNYKEENGVLSFVAPSMAEGLKDKSKVLTNAETSMRFLSKEALAIYELTKNMSPEELQKNEGIQNAILDVFQRDMGKRLEGYEDQSYEAMFSSVIRANSAPEWMMYNMLMGASVTDEMRNAMAGAYKANANPDKIIDNNKGLEQDYSGVDEALAATASALFPAKGETLTGKILGVGMETLGTSSHFGKDDQTDEGEKNASRMLMNNLFLRGFNPQMAQKGIFMQNDYVNARADQRIKEETEKQLALEKEKKGRELTKEEYNSTVNSVPNYVRGLLKDEAKKAKIGTEYSDTAILMQKALANEGQTVGSRSFLELLKEKFKKS